MKKLFAVILVLAMIFSMAACAEREQSDTAKTDTGTEPAETMLAYVPEELPCPERLGDIWSWDSWGDTIWLAGMNSDNTMYAASYDTINGHWQSYELDSGRTYNMCYMDISVSEDSLWILFRGYDLTEYVMDPVNAELMNCVYTMDINSRQSSCAAIPFEAGGGTESSVGDFISILALDAGRALLSSEEKSYLIGPEAKVLDAPELPVKRKLIRLRVNEQIYLHLNEGFAPFDEETLEFGDVTHLNNQGVFSSNAGSFIGTEGKILYRYDPETGEKTKVFDWMDVILRLNDLDESRAFENSAGEFFYATGRKIVKISQRQVRQKQQLTLVSYVNVEDGTGRYDPKNGAGASAIMDAIIRFNNTDPEYNVKLKTVLYSTEAERNRLMVELATTDEYDLVDTCMLPEDAVKAGVMTDLLPYIDADEEISRDDFIEPLFSAMLKDGGLYEYTDKFTLLTLTAEKSLFPGRGNWTTEYIMESLAQRDDRDCLDRSRLMIDFVPAATAEFIDWDKMSCSFDSEAFKNWLVFLKGCPEGVETYEDPPLFYVCIDLAAELGMGAWTHGAPQDCVVAGFPETAGTGSYFVKLEGAEPVMRALTYGNYSRIAMPAAGKHQDGAWRFVRTLMLGDSEPAISAGIPVFKDSFEKGIEAALAGGKNLTGEMAEILRGQVYNTDKLVHYDEDLFRIINTEASAYFDGQKTVDEAAQQIQSRISIYLAEHSG